MEIFSREHKKKKETKKEKVEISSLATIFLINFRTIVTYSILQCEMIGFRPFISYFFLITPHSLSLSLSLSHTQILARLSNEKNLLHAKTVSMNQFHSLIGFLR